MFILIPEMIVATEKGSQAILADGLAELVRPVIRNMFVGLCIAYNNKFSLLSLEG